MSYNLGKCEIGKQIREFSVSSSDLLLALNDGRREIERCKKRERERGRERGREGGRERERL